jgi:hypothetical protein
LDSGIFLLVDVDVEGEIFVFGDRVEGYGVEDLAGTFS